MHIKVMAGNKIFLPKTDMLKDQDNNVNSG